MIVELADKSRLESLVAHLTGQHRDIAAPEAPTATRGQWGFVEPISSGVRLNLTFEATEALREALAVAVGVQQALKQTRYSVILEKGAAFDWAALLPAIARVCESHHEVAEFREYSGPTKWMQAPCALAGIALATPEEIEQAMERR